MRKLLALSLLFISGCAVHPYWTKTYAPNPALFIVHNDYPCGEKWDACWNPKGRTIELRKGLSQADEECLTRHEYAHAMGWRHPLNEALATDCGPEKI